MTAKPKPAFSWDDIEALRRDCGLAQDDCPPHAFTTDEYAARVQLTRQSAGRELRQMVDAKRMKRGRAIRRGADGRQARVWVYWPA